MFNVSKDFEDYALSYSGHNGGDINGKYWFCGIEPGAELLDFQNIKPITEIPDCNLYNSWQISHKVAHLIRDINPKLPKDATYKEAGWFFANLYPLAFPKFENAYWKNEHTDYTGFFTKDEYKIWCQKYRFLELRKMIQSGQSKTIVCSGTGCRNDFLLAFYPQDKIRYILFSKNRNIVNISNGNKPKNIEIIDVNSDNVMKIIITPFFGQWGMNNTEEIKKISQYL